MDFTMGQNLNKLKLTLWAEKFTNIVLEYTKRCGIATFWWGGVCFLRKVHFINIFMRNHDFRFLRLQLSSIVISKI